MLTELRQWCDVLVCPICLHALQPETSITGFSCNACGNTFRLDDNIPVCVENSNILSGLKESSELTAQRDTHNDEVARLQTSRKVHSRIMELLDKHHITPSLESKILEIGSGPFESLHDVTGNIKISIDPLATSYRDNLSFKRVNSNIVQGFAEVLPFSNNFFDILVSRNSFDHLNNPSLAIMEFNRVLKPDGICILECYVDSDPFASSEPFVLTERFIFNYISKYFYIVSSKRVPRQVGFTWDWIELELKPINVLLSHRPYTAHIYEELAESYLDLYSRGYEALKQCRTNDAISLLRQSIKKSPDYFWNSLTLIEAYTSAGRYQEALTELDAMRTKLSTGQYPHINLPEIHIQRLLQIIPPEKQGDRSVKVNKQIRILLIVCLYENNFGDILIYLTVKAKLEENGFKVDIYEVSQPLFSSDFFEKANNSDFVLFAGGGIIERNAPDIIRLFENIHHLLKAPYGVMGLSTGDFDYTPFARSLQLFCDNAAFFFTRDSDSVATFKKYGAIRPPAAGVDVVFANEQLARLEKNGHDVTANFRNIPYPDVTGDINWHAWSESLKRVGVQYLLRDCSNAHLQLGLPISGNDMLSDISRSQLIVAMRFHVILVAAMLGIPIIPIAYCPKVRRLSHQLGLSDYCLGTHDHDKLDEAIRLMSSNREATMQTLAMNVSLMRNEASSLLRQSINIIKEICQ